MALRHRDIVSAVADRENLNIKPVKAQLSKQLTKRPALDELSNKINGLKNAATKKPEAKDNPAQKKELVKSYSSQRLETIVDPDLGSKNDPQMVTEYLADVYAYLRDLEAKFPIREKFLTGHQSTPKMRATLVNWLVQVHASFKLCLETLYMCVSITDRYLQDNKNIGRETLQLVGTSALLIACKYEEIYLPGLSDFVYICDDTFSKNQILKMEMDILIKLECNLGRPLPIHFLRRYSKIAQVQSEQHTLAKYLLELALLDYNMAHVKPSIQAAAACFLSISILNSTTCPSKVWTSTLVHYTTYKYSDFQLVVVSFANMLLKVDSSKHQSIQSKYAASNFSKISLNPKLKGYVVKKFAESGAKS